MGSAARTRTVTPAAEARPSRTNFLRILFQGLEEEGIRYCVLHSWEMLPELDSDLDLAVHPRDGVRLRFVFSRLQQHGYHPVQCLNYVVNGFYFVFGWFEGLELRSLAVDLIFEHRRDGLILTSGEELVAQRRKKKDFWVPAAGTEFVYLLAKKAWKGIVPYRQEQRLQSLVAELGRVEAERLTGKLFGEKWKSQVVEACARGCAGQLIRKLRRPLWWNTVTRDPLNPLRNLLSDAVRRVRRWLEPTGLFVGVLGPDGVGKSTLIQRLMQELLPLFRRKRVFHFRPRVLLRPRYENGLGDPNYRIPRSAFLSVLKLAIFLLDYWVGHWLVVRPLLARSGLVVFDRYAPDVVVDPLRYRYGGPMGVAKLLSTVVPAPSLAFLFLDAREEVILSRKSEVLLSELQRQRKAYKDLGKKLGNMVSIRTDQEIEVTLADASRLIVSHLARRFQQRHGCWLEPSEKRLGVSLQGTP